jgi:DNA repair protein SbcD/Mre11
MKFAHLADCHIGSWSDSRMRELSDNAAEKAFEVCMQENVDFVLVSGDLFNSALPNIDSLKLAVELLKQLYDKQIKVYVIPGSHDYSPSGKTMLDVLEKAGLVVNVYKAYLDKGYLVDEKTGAIITGILGKRGGLEKEDYENLNIARLENLSGFKIFMFHSAVEGFVPNELEAIKAIDLALFPKGFDYYAGGHLHIVEQKKVEGYGVFAYPGPVLPDNFKELEDLKNGGLYIIDAKDSLKVMYKPIVVCNVHGIDIDCEGLTPEKVNSMLRQEAGSKELINTVVTIRLRGELLTGKRSDIEIKEISKLLTLKGALCVLKNTNKLSSKEFQGVDVRKGSVEETERALIEEHVDQITLNGYERNKQIKLVEMLMQVLGTEKGDGEKVSDFEKRVKEEVKEVLGV